MVRRIMLEGNCVQIRRMISRRRLILMTGTGIVIAAGALVVPGWLRSYSAARQLAVRLLAGLPSATAFSAIGKSYLEASGASSDIVSLVARITERWPVDPSSISLAQCQQILHMQINHDFAQGRLHLFQSWIFSVTEARLCALAFLSK